MFLCQVDYCPLFPWVIRFEGNTVLMLIPLQVINSSGYFCL